MSTRASALALVVVFSVVSLKADEVPAVSSDVISNWTAPPYWILAKPAAPEKGAEVGLTPQAVTGVPTAPLAFTGITPCRIADTRGNGFTGQYGPPQITGAGRNITIMGQCGIPAGAEAVSFNFHAANIAAAGFLVAYPAGGAFPPVAVMAYNQTTPVISTAAVVPLGAGGAITVVAGSTNVDLIIDTNGYYAPQTVVNTINTLSGAVTLAPGSNISITPAGNTLTIANTAPAPPAAWQLTGNSGTTPGTNFLGTTDNQALEIKVNNQRAMRFEPHIATMVPNVIGGSGNNNVTPGVYSATIAGGGFAANSVTDAGGTVGGGSGNRAGDNAGTTIDQLAATVGGGSGNVANGGFSVIGGGQTNTTGPGGSWMTVAGGLSNLAQADGATVGGGLNNTANNGYATVPGGRSNAATQLYAFAAGRRAKAVHQGALVWGDSTDADVLSTADNQFVARARGGFTFYPDASTTCTLTSVTGWQCSGVSDRNLKRQVVPVDVRETLTRLIAVPIQTWSYDSESPPVRHMGPMAQDFAAAYRLGADDKTINPIDANGVALAAIQALYAEVQELKRHVAELEAAKN